MKLKLIEAFQGARRKTQDASWWVAVGLGILAASQFPGNKLLSDIPEA